MKIGWRLDYFLVSSELAGKIIKSDICEINSASDHVPIILEIQLN